MTELVILSGLPGTGKSTLAHRLALELRWTLLCIDDLLGEVPHDADLAFWDSKIDILLDLIERQLRIGLSVVADSVFMDADRQHAQELARKYNARFLPIHVFVSDEETWKGRVSSRFARLGNPEVATWERIQRQREGFREWEPGTALFIDSLYPLEENLADALDFISERGASLQPLKEIPLTRGRYHHQAAP
jgi:predicted kinase